MPNQALKSGKNRRKQTKKTSPLRKTSDDAVVVLDKLFGTRESDAYMLEERERVLIGNQIYEMRRKAGITQGVLAKKVGTTASIIARLEDADYEGHSFAMLRKIASVFGTRVEIQFAPSQKPAS